MHTKMLEYSKELNKFYCDNKALWQVDFDWRGFRWIDCNDNENSVISFIRYAEDQDDFIVVVCNFTPEVRHGYRIGVPAKVFNSDAEKFGGSNVLNEGEFKTEDVFWHNLNQSIQVTLPPLATIFFKMKDDPARAKKQKIKEVKPVSRSYTNREPEKITALG